MRRIFTEGKAEGAPRERRAAGAATRVRVQRTYLRRNWPRSGREGWRAGRAHVPRRRSGGSARTAVGSAAGRGCSHPRRRRGGSRHQLEASLIASLPLRRADFLRATDPQISKRGAQALARRLFITGAPRRAWTFLTILCRVRPRTPLQGFSENHFPREF